MSTSLIAGNETGLLDSSLFLLNRNDNTGAGSTGGDESLFVNVSNGNLLIQHRDVYMPSLGDDFQLVRTYNARGAASDAHQHEDARWYFSTGIRLDVRNGNEGQYFDVQYGDGSVFDYHLNEATGLWESHDGAGAYETIADLGATGNEDPAFELTRADQTRLYFDKQGRLLSWVDTNGVRMEYTYASDRLQQIRDDQGHEINYLYENGVLFQVTDENEGVLAEYHYESGRLSEVIDRMGHSTKYFYTNNGFIERIELPAEQVVDGQAETYEARTIQIQYDSINWRGENKANAQVVTEIVDAEGGVTSFDYDFQFHSAATQSNGQGHIISNGKGHLKHGDATATDSTTYDTKFFDGGSTTVVDALGNNRAYSNEAEYVQWRTDNGFYASYDAAVAAENPSFQAQVDTIRQAHSLQYSYLSNGYITEVVDQQGYHTTYSYDDLGNLISVTDRNGWAAVNSDSDYNRQLRAELGVVDAAGLGKLVATLTETEKALIVEAYTSHFSYDERGNLLQAEDNNGSQTTFTYTAFNKVASTTSALGNELVSSDSDFAQAKRAEILGLAAPVLLADLTTAQRQALLDLHTTYFEYDANQNLIEQRDPGGDLTRYTYDVYGNRTQRVAYLDSSDLTNVASQQITRYFYDGFGNNIETVDAEGNHTFAEYDHFGNLTRFIDGNGGITTYSYDNDNRLLTVTDPEGHTTAYTYDAVGNRISVTDARGHTITRIYDRNNRLIAVIDPSAGDPAADRITQFNYDVVGNQTQVTDAEGRVTTYSYNVRRELVEVTTPEVAGADGNPTHYYSSFAYDGEGNRITSTNQRGFTTEVLYNEDGLVTETRQANGHTTRYVYDANNNQLQIIAGVQLAEAARQILKYRYDEENQLVEVTDAMGGITTYGIDAVGNRESMTDANGNEYQYEYDHNNRLVREIMPEVVDPVTGLPTNYTIEHRYDANGNRVELVDQNGHSTVYTYDKDNAVVMVEDANGIKTVFEYDANHNRTAVSIGVEAELDVDGHVLITDTNGGQRNTFVYDEFNQLVATTDGLGHALVSNNDALYQAMRTDRGFAADVALLSDSDKQALLDLYTSHIAYDRVGNQITVVDNLNRVTSFAYDNLNRLVTTTDAADGITRNRYDGNGNLVATLDAEGREVTFAYDSVDRLTDATNALGTVTHSVYDDFGNLISQTRASGTVEARTSTFDYDLNNRLIRETDPELHSRSYRYDAVGNRLEVVDGRNNATQYVYDALNRNVRIIDPLSFETRFEYDGVGNRLAIIDANAGVSRFDYDPGNRQIQLTDTEGRVTRYAYDTLGNRIEMRTAAGTADEEITIFEYDAQSNLRRVVDAEGYETTRDYDRVYNQIAITDGNGHTTRSEFDALNRLVRVVDAENQVTQYRYDAVSNRVEVIDALNRSTTYAYDADNRLIVQTAADNVQTHYQYDRVDNRVAITHAANTADATTETFVYNKDDLLVSQSDALGNTTSYDYDENHNRTLVTDPNGHATEYTYDANNRVVQITDPLDGVITYAYDGNGNRTQVTDKRGFVSTTYYNHNNEVVGRVDKEGYFTSLAYDNNGNVVRETLHMTAVGSVDPALQPVPVASADDQTTLFEYDKLNRLTGRVDAEGYRNEFAYDGVGNRIETRVFRDLAATDVAVTRSFYDDVDRLVDRVTAEGYLTHTTYDQVGNVTSRTLYDQRVADSTAPEPQSGDAGRTTTFTYDQVNRLVQETSPLGVNTGYEYDARGNRLAVIDAAGSAYERRTSFVYDAANRLTDSIDAHGTVTHLALDADGNVIAQYDAYGTAEQRVTTSEYDGNHQLIRQTNAFGVVSVFSYDAAGNLLARTDAAGLAEARTNRYQYDGLGRMVAEANGEGERTEYRYDGAGNQIQVTVAPGLAEQRVNTFEYDRDNRQIAAVDGEGVRTEYEYDGAGNKLHTIQAVGVAGKERHSFYLYDLDNRLVETTDAMNGVTSYTYDVLGNQTQIINANGGVQENTFDILGRLVSSLSAGGTLTQNSYDLRGNTLSTTQSFVDGSDARTTTYAYDLLDRQVAVTDGEGYTTSINYDLFGNQTQVTLGQYLVAVGDPAYDADKAALAFVQSNQFTFDAADRMLSMTDGEGSVTEYTYDAVGNRLSMTEAANGLAGTAPRTTQYSYDLANRLTQQITPEGGISRYDYDEAGNKIAEHLLQSADGGADIWINRSFEYDRNARMTAEIDPYGVRTEHEFDALGNEVITRMAAGTSDARITRMEYDLNNRKTADVDGEGYRTEYHYDAMGNRIRATDALGRVARFYFDGANRLVATLDPEGIVTRFAFDSVGNRIDERIYASRYTGPVSDLTPPAMSASSDDRVVHSEYDRNSRMVAETLPDGTRNQTVYDGAGNTVRELLFTNTSAPRVREYSFDLNNRLVHFVDVDGTETEFEWDAANNKTADRIISATDDHAVRETLYSYDLNNRLLSQTFDQAGLNIVQRNVYDKLGNVVQQINGNGVATRYSYDLNNRILTETNGLNETVAYSYDAVGNAVSKTDARGVSTSYVYDHNNRVVEERGAVVDTYTISGGVQTEQLIVRREYDAFGNQVKVTDPAGYSITSYFDANGRKVAEIGADNVLMEWGYNNFGEAVSETLFMQRLTDAAHDPASRPAAPAGEARLTEREYDVMGREIRVIHPEIDVTTVAANDPQNPSATVARVRPESSTQYDAYGNIQRQTDSNGNEFYNFYDSKDRRIATIDGAGYLTEFAFDAQDNLIEQRVYTVPVDMAQVTATGYSQPTGEVWITNREYDAASRLVAETSPLTEVYDIASGQVVNERIRTEWSYDATGNQLSQTRAADSTQAITEYYYYDAADRKVAVVNANRVVHLYGYDANGNETLRKRYFNAVDGSVDLASLDGRTTNFATLVAAHANDQATVYGIDDANRVVSETDLMAAAAGDELLTHHRYNARNEITWTEDADGFVSKMAYDGAGRVVQNIAPDGTGSSMEFDAAGNQIFVYTGEIDSQAIPATNVTANVGQDVVIGWDLPQGGGLSSRVVWDSSSHSNLADYANDSGTLATWFDESGEIYIPADQLTAGEELYFRVVTTDRAGNQAWSAEQVLRVPPSASDIQVQQTGADSVVITAALGGGATNAQLNYGVLGSTANPIAMTDNGDGTVSATLSGVPNLQELAYSISYEAAGAVYSTPEYPFEASEPHYGVTTELGQVSVVSGAGTGYKASLDSRIPAALAANMDLLMATWTLDGSDAATMAATAEGVDSGNGYSDFALEMGTDAAPLSAGTYTVTLTGVLNQVDEIDAGEVIIDQFKVTIDSATPLEGTRQSLSWAIPEVGDELRRDELVVLAGQPTVSSRAAGALGSQQLVAGGSLAAGTHHMSSYYGERFADSHDLSVASTEITQTIPYDPTDTSAANYNPVNDPNDPNYDPAAPLPEPLVETLGYDVSVAVDLAASEVANLQGDLQLAWREAGTDTTFANSELLVASGSGHYEVTLPLLDSELTGQAYDLKLFYTDADGNEVIVDWLQVQADSANVTKTNQSLTVLASETDAEVTVSASGAISIDAGLYSGPVNNDAQFVTVAVESTGLVGGSQDADGRTTGYFIERRFDAQDNLIATNEGDGIWREYGVDANGNRVAEHRYGVEGNTEVRSSFMEYDARNRQITNIAVATNVYDEASALRAVERYAYDVLDNRVLTQDAAGYNNREIYNGLNQMVQTVDGNFNVEQTFFDRLGNEVKMVDGLGNESYKQYDASGRMIAEIDGEGRITEYRYDVFDRRIKVIDGLGNSTDIEYDHRNRVVSATNALGLSQSYAYDGRDNRIETIDENGNKTTAEYDGLGRVILTTSLQDGQTLTLQRQYDAYGNMVASIDEMGRVTSYEFGEFGRKLAEVDQAGRRTLFEYDDFGNMIREYREAPNWFSNLGSWGGGLFDFSYFDFGSLLRLWGLFNTTPDIHRSYDAAGRLIAVDDLTTGVKTTYQYDVRGNRAEEHTTGTGGHNRRVTYAYDALGQMTRWADAVTGLNLNYQWDAAGNQKRVYTDAGTEKMVNHWYEYDASNKVTAMTNGNGGSIISGYSYDDAGRRASWNNNGTIVSYQYDDIGRVIRADWQEGSDAKHSTWQYDNTGNVLAYREFKNGTQKYYKTEKFYENGRSYFTNDDGDKSTMTLNKSGQVKRMDLITDGSKIKYKYYYHPDGRENYITGYGPNDSYGRTNFTYNANDQVTRIDKGEGDNQSRREYLTFVYNNDGQILYRFHDEGKGDKVHKTEYLYANGNPVGEKKVNTKTGDVKIKLDTGNYNLIQNMGDEYPTSGPTNFTVNEGDTLQTVAAAVYGNPNLWFLIADANNVEPGQELKAGSVLSVPNSVETGRLTSDTHVVYNEGDIIGSNLPNLKTPEDDDDCGGFLAIIITIIVVVVAVYTGYVSTEALAAAWGGGAVATFAATVVGAAIGAAVGSIVGQGLRIAAGLQDGFDWGAVGEAAVQGAITAGVGELLQGVQGLKAVSELVKNSKVAAAAVNMASSAIVQLAENGKITSWSSVAVAGIASGLDTNGIKLGGDALTFEVGGATLDFSNAWVDLASSYIDNGELTTADWVGAVGNTIANAVQQPVVTGGEGERELNFGNFLKNQGANLLIGGGLALVDKQAGINWLHGRVEGDGKAFVKQASAAAIENAARREQQRIATASKLSAPIELDPNDPIRYAMLGIEPGVMVDTGAASLLGGPMGTQFNDGMRAELGYGPLAEQTRTIQQGDSFWDLAKSDLGTGATDAEILARTQQYMEANQGVDPRQLQVGQQVSVPGAGLVVSEATKVAYGESDAGLREFYASQSAANDVYPTIGSVGFNDVPVETAQRGINFVPEERSLNPFSIIYKEGSKELGESFRSANTAIDEWQQSVKNSYRYAKDDASNVWEYVGLSLLDEVAIDFVFSGIDLVQSIGNLATSEGRYNLYEDVRTASQSWDDFRAFSQDPGADIRGSIKFDLGFGEIKVLGGTDFLGAQYKWPNKGPGGEQTVSRFSYDWENGFGATQIVQKDVNLVGGRDSAFQVKTGVRLGYDFNLEPSVRNSLDFSAQFKKSKLGVGFGLELRGPKLIESK